jgi:diguanylate cyclase (GGDEF)-like protein/PAS domain S-box-containing protein
MRRKNKPNNLISGKYSIGDLVDFDKLRDVFEKFTEATGFTIGFVDYPSQEILIATGWRDICTKFHRISPKSAKHCKTSNVHLTSQLKKAHQIVVEECKNGLVDCATPIIVRGKHIASLATGQVFVKKPDLNRFKKQARIYGYDLKKYLKAVKEVPVVSKEQLKGVMLFLGAIAVMIAESGFSALEVKKRAKALEKEIAERKKAEVGLRTEKEKVQHYLDIASVIMVAIGANQKVLLINKKGCEILGCAQKDIVGKKWFDNFVPKRMRQDVKGAFKKLISGDISMHEYYENPILTKNGEERVIAWHSTFLKNEKGKIVSTLSSGQDITERKKAYDEQERLRDELIKTNKKLKEASLVDFLTGLYNYRYLTSIIEPEFYRAKKHAIPLSIIMFDIDYFKSVNEVYGHKFGDLVLKQFAAQLKRMVHKYDTVVRFSGEEFLVMSPTIRSQAMNMADNILEKLHLHNFGDKQQTVKLQLSAAVVAYPGDHVFRGIGLVELADQILNRAKEDGGDRVYSSVDIIKRPSVHLEEKPDVKRLKTKIDQLSKRANQNIVESIFAFAKTIEVKDHYTGEHVEKTVSYATETAKELNLSKEEIWHITQAAILHDLGKIGISERILRKKGKLTKKEYEEIKKHPMIAADILRPLQFFHDIIPLILYHHERWDGKGYPYGLKGEEIPVGSRIVAIADEYQALVSDRPYRKAYSKEKAIEVLKTESNTKYDPEILKVFFKVVSKMEE